MIRPSLWATWIIIMRWGCCKSAVECSMWGKKNPKSLCWRLCPSSLAITSSYTIVTSQWGWDPGKSHLDSFRLGSGVLGWLDLPRRTLFHCLYIFIFICHHFPTFSSDFKLNGVSLTTTKTTKEKIFHRTLTFEKFAFSQTGPKTHECCWSLMLCPL